MTKMDEVNYRRGAGFLLASLGRRAEREWHGYLTAHGVTTAQFTAVAALATGEQTQTQVADLTAVDPRNLSTTIKQLVAKGWVKSRPNPDDARSRLLSLTPTGIAWWDELQPGLSTERRRFFGTLTPDELATLEELLRRLESTHASESIRVPGKHC